MNNPTISVIVPVYNAEKYLKKCLESICNQTYQQLSVLVIDDGSTDCSGEICDQYAKWDSRFMVWHTENKGSFAARNLALSFVQTPYIGFVDADDWVEKDMYEVLYKEIIASQADFVQCAILNEGEYFQMRNNVGEKERITRRGNEIYEGLYSEIISHSVNDKLFRSDLFRKVLFEEKYYHSDAMAMMKLAQYCGKICIIGKPLYHYRTDNESITRSVKSKKHMYSTEKLFSVYDEMAYKAQGISDYFLCKEIPCMGRAIFPNHNVSVREAMVHTRYMHKIFCEHWENARKCAMYKKSSFAKQIYWNIYYIMPKLSMLLLFVRYVYKEQIYFRGK